MLKSLLNQIAKSSQKTVQQTEDITRKFIELEKLVRELPSLLQAPVHHVPLSERLKQLMDDLIDFLGSNTNALNKVEERQAHAQTQIREMQETILKLQKQIDHLIKMQTEEGQQQEAFRSQVRTFQQIFLVDD